MYYPEKHEVIEYYFWCKPYNFEGEDPDSDFPLNLALTEQQMVKATSINYEDLYEDSVPYWMFAQYVAGERFSDHDIVFWHMKTNCIEKVLSKILDRMVNDPKITHREKQILLAMYNILFIRHVKCVAKK